MSARTITHGDRASRYTATVELSSHDGQPAYFSATYEHKENGRDSDGGYMDEELAASVFPELLPVARVHMSDEHGVPMYAVENGIYWAGLSKWNAASYMKPKPPHGHELVADDEGREWCPTMLAQHLRVSLGQAYELRDEVLSGVHPGSHKEAFALAIEALRPTWQMEADAALAAIGTGS